MDKGRYSIIFSSLTGNTKKLADTIRAVLPSEDCDYFGAPETAELHSEMLYVGFWTDKGNADSAALGLLSKLRNKKIFLFGTAGFGGAPEYFEQILGRVREHLPEGAKYLGGAMCQGRMGDAVRARYEAMLAKQPGDARIQAMIENFDAARSHPDADDLARIATAAKQALGL